MSYSCCPVFIFSDEKAATKLSGVSLYVMNHFSFTVFKISSLFLAFSIFTRMYLTVDFFEFILFGPCQASGVYRLIFTIKFGKSLL